MSVRSVATMVLALLVAVPAFAGRTTEMQAFDDIKVEESTGKSVTADQVKQAILTAARARKWVPKDAAPGQITATILIRGKFRVNVEIPYSATQFSVKHVSSENLNYEMTKDGPEIHPQYNKWVGTLVNDIKTQLTTI